MGCVDDFEDKMLTDLRNHLWFVNSALLGHNNHDTPTAGLACALLALGACGPEIGRAVGYNTSPV